MNAIFLLKNSFNNTQCLCGNLT